MHDGVQFDDTVRKGGVGQAFAIDFPVAIQYLAPKSLNYGGIGRLTGHVEAMSQRVCLEEVRAAHGQHLSNRGLAAGNAAGKAYPQH